MRTREFHLAARPHGEPRETDFALVETELPEPADGQVLVANRFLSVDPYMRGRMNDAPSYVPAFGLGAPLEGGAVGEVVESRAEGLSPGDLVLHGLGWREHALLDARHARKVDPGAAPASAYLGVLGMPGLTAYVGLLDIAQMREGDAVFVSGAAGAVGSLAGQIARLRGARRVIGSAGSEQKTRWLVDELGFDVALNYRDAPIARQLRDAAPDGIEVYFDNVGGDHLEAAISVLNTHGRVALCGAISQYNATEPAPGPRNLFLAVGKRLRLQGYIILDHGDRMAAFVEEVGGWLRDGRIAFRETFADGLDVAPGAFIGLLRGANVGKMVIRLP